MGVDAHHVRHPTWAPAFAGEVKRDSTAVGFIDPKYGPQFIISTAIAVA
jgi:hypothetical protein